MLLGQPLHPLKHALQIFTEASKEGWGTHLNEYIARGNWSLPESKLHINYLELTAHLDEHTARGQWSLPESKLHINHLELKQYF